MRVQRTRSSPSALRSPLTRHPLGRENSRSAIAIGLGATLVCLALECSASRFQSPETWRIVMQTEGGGRIGVFTIQLTGQKAHGKQYGPTGWVESGEVIASSSAGSRFHVPAVADQVLWEHSASAEAFSIRVSDDRTGEEPLIFDGRLHDSQATGTFAEDREFASSQGYFDAVRL